MCVLIYPFQLLSLVMIHCESTSALFMFYQLCITVWLCDWRSLFNTVTQKANRVQKGLENVSAIWQTTYRILLHFYKVLSLMHSMQHKLFQVLSYYPENANKNIYYMRDRFLRITKFTVTVEFSWES